MIKWLASAILTVMISAAALGVDLRETLGTFPACKTLYAIRSYTSYLGAGDKVSAQNLFDSKDCSMLEGGVPVYLMERMGRFVQIRIQADSKLVWTVKEAVE